MQLSEKETEIVKMALRGHAQCMTKRAEAYEKQSASLAALTLMREVWTIQAVLRREFGDAS
jgi:hypothetical protein